jgi:ABC-type sugar transport system substrate-binding protein
MRYLTDLYKPKYLQLYEIIKDEINLGKYKKNDRMPSESELIREFNVSSITVRKCIDLLKNEGLIERIQGVGTFIKVEAETEYRVDGLVFGVNALLATNEWSSEVERGIRRIVTAARGSVFFTDARGDVERQKQNLIDMILKKPDIIYVLLANPEKMSECVELAGQYSIPIISVEAYLEGPSVKSHLNADQMINGILNADNIIDYLAITHGGHVSGNLLDVYSPGTYTIDLRHRAMLFKLQEYPAVRIRKVINYDKTRSLEDTREKVRSYLEKHADEIDVVTAHFGEPLTGAILAVEDAGQGERIKVIGVDAFRPVVELMKRGMSVIAAVQQDGYAMGTVAAKVGIKVLQGEAVAYRYVLPLISIYSNFPHRMDNYPENEHVKINCPLYLKQLGFDWGY